MTPEEAKNRSRGYSTDMSPDAIARRILIASEMRELGLLLAKSKPVAPPPNNNSGGEETPPPVESRE